jgi:nucleoside-diphosphate-sugar epimerase
MKKIVITGATGFVGANLARFALRGGHEVHLLVRKKHRPWRIDDIRNDVSLHISDMLDREVLSGIFGSVKPDWIFHLAAYGAYSYQRDTDKIFHTNLLGTINLFEAARTVGFEAFINTGSSSEYGLKDHAPMEDEHLEPNSHYAVSKAAATMFCRYRARQEELYIPTLRLYSVYGPFEEPARLMPALIANGLSGTLPPLVSPKTGRDFIYVEDVCNIYLKVAEHTPKEDLGPVYNVGTGIQSTIGDTVDIVRSILDIKEEPDWGSMDQRDWDTNVWVSNPERIKRELRWEPQYDLRHGMTRFIDWFRDHPDYLDYYRKALAGVQK